MIRNPGAMTSNLKIALIAGEASGDALGAELMASLKQEAGERSVSFIGVGGVLMAEEGLTSFFPMSDLSVMGITEILPRLPKILCRLKQTIHKIEQEKPDILVTIDSPDFCFRVATALKKRAIHRPEMFHYVAPTVWAWRPERAAKVAALYDGIICLYPFEPPFFEREGMKAVFAGHPVLEKYVAHPDVEKIRQELDIPQNAPVLGVLFGSRISELNRTGPVLREVVARLAAENKALYILSPTFPHLEKMVTNFLQGLPCETRIVTDHTRKWDCFRVMDRALATSGTVGLELAVADVPHVVAYKASPLTAAIIKRKILVRHFHLANILLDHPVVPEFIQEHCKAEKIAQAMKTLAIENQKTAFAEVRKMLGQGADGSPSKIAAHFILSGYPPTRI